MGVNKLFDTHCVDDEPIFHNLLVYNRFGRFRRGQQPRQQTGQQNRKKGASHCLYRPAALLPRTLGGLRLLVSKPSIKRDVRQVNKTRVLVYHIQPFGYDGGLSIFTV
jgi:hypothetical protein